MQLWIDGEADLSHRTCERCGSVYQDLRVFVLDDEGPFAIVIVECHHHDGVHEAFFDVVLGDFGSDEDDEPEPDPSTRTLSSCRVGPIEGLADPAASMLDAPSRPEWAGTPLTREQALAHPRVADVWSVVDHLLAEEPTVRAHVYGGPAPVDRRRWWRSRRAR